MLQHSDEKDFFFMDLALKEAKKAFDSQEVPVGAVLVHEDKVICSAYNQIESLQDPTAHAEILCLREGAKLLKNWRLIGATLYITLEPCSMCLGAMFLARISRIVYAAPDIRHGACGSWVNLLETKHPIHQLEVTKNVLQEQSSELLVQFFRERRKENENRSRQDRRAF